MAKFEPVQFQVVVEFAAQDRERLDNLLNRIDKLVDRMDAEVADKERDDGLDLAQRIRDWPVRYEDTELEHVDPYGDTP